MPPVRAQNGLDRVLWSVDDCALRFRHLRRSAAGPTAITRPHPGSALRMAADRPATEDRHRYSPSSNCSSAGRSGKMSEIRTACSSRDAVGQLDEPDVGGHFSVPSRRKPPAASGPPKGYLPSYRSGLALSHCALWYQRGNFEQVPQPMVEEMTTRSPTPGCTSSPAARRRRPLLA